MKSGIIVLILLISGHLSGAQEITREPVEEVVAVVDRTPLLLSDIDLAELLAIVERPVGATDAEYRAAILDARILLEVQFRDLEASGVLYRLDLDVTEVRRAMLAAAGETDQLLRNLHTAGLGEVDVDELALRVCAANAYAEQRLRPRINVSLQEIESAYRRLAVDLESQGDVAPHLTAVQDQLRRLISERKLNEEIERWVARALEEREVTRFVQ